MSAVLDSPRAQRLRAWDGRLIQAASGIHMLGTLSWGPQVATHWLAHRTLPEIPLEQADHSAKEQALRQLMAEVDTQDPAGAFLHRTAASYVALIQLLSAQGQPRFVSLSRELFGAPSDRISPRAPTHLEAAQHFLEATEALPIPEPADDWDSAQAQAWMEAQLSHLPRPLPVELSDGISAKATAGARRIRLRVDARFSPHTLRQLLEHEAKVHAYTKRNGADQPVLSSMGLSSPRTTMDQEGLATFAELITDTMDHRRLRRIALRVVAVAAALDGASFGEVVRIFEEGGQAPTESFQSAARVFRGGNGRDGVVFTKDTVYLAGLLRVQAFLVQAFRARRMLLPIRFFAGRWTLGDARDLEPCIEEGLITEPSRAPEWARNAGSLAAHLAWASFQGGVLLKCTSLSDL